ncbi:MAG: hypothetical protein ACREGD_02165 [Candidatus Saccharimonadales bacterium]
MTRFLRNALGAEEPTFSQSIRQLERAAGAPSADIRLTSELVCQVKAKVAELGLDPNDTSGQELYEVLRQRLVHDEALVRYRLGVPVDAPPPLVADRVRHFLGKLDAPAACFALKNSVAKKMLRAKPPKTAMKRLGYRSADSMLKHEPAAQLYAAALIYESPSWHKSFLAQYVKLSPGDFEPRRISVLHPKSTKWQQASRDFAGQTRQVMAGFRELGAVVLLPPADHLDGLAITTLLLAIEEMNEIRAYSSFIKLQQVKPAFGRIVQQSSRGELLTSATLAGRPVPWRMVQRYYATFKEAYHPELFEPHVQPEDLSWHKADEALVRLEPSLRFWQGTAMLALMDQDEPVSLNILDVAISQANHLAFGHRVVHFFRANLWHELMSRYLHQENLETAVSQQLSGDLLDNQPKQEVPA